MEIRQSGNDNCLCVCMNNFNERVDGARGATVTTFHIWAYYIYKVEVIKIYLVRTVCFVFVCVNATLLLDDYGEQLINTF